MCSPQYETHTVVEEARDGRDRGMPCEWKAVEGGGFKKVSTGSRHYVNDQSSPLILRYESIARAKV